MTCEDWRASAIWSQWAILLLGLALLLQAAPCGSPSGLVQGVCLMALAAYQLGKW